MRGKERGRLGYLILFIPRVELPLTVVGISKTWPMAFQLSNQLIVQS